MASALHRTASRLRPVQLYRRIRASSCPLSPSPTSPACISDRHGDFSVPRSLSSLSSGIEMLKMDQRCLLSTSTSDTTSKPNPGNPETKSSCENEKSGGSESSDGGSDQKNDRASGKDVRGAPVSWMSFFLLFATGAGLVYYYDREKKRHIEGTNLW